jgi:chaperonin cofactor prefoldin
MARANASEMAARFQRKLAGIQHLVYKLKAIRALYVTAHNSSMEVQQIAAEFYYAVGDLLEGQKVEELKLPKINREEFLREFNDE